MRGAGAGRGLGIESFIPVGRLVHAALRRLVPQTVINSDMPYGR